MSQTILHRVRVRALPVLLGGMLAGGCVGRPFSSLPDLPLASTELASLTVTPPTSIIAVGGTQQLAATGLTFAGVLVTTFDSVQYLYRTPADSARLRLSSTGLMTGLVTTTTGVLVNVLAYKGPNAIRGDQIIAQVTPTAIPGLTLSIQPIAPDSAKLAAGNTKTIVPVLKNPTNGVSVANPSVIYQVKDSAHMLAYRSSMFYQHGADFLYLREVNTPLINLFLTPNQVFALADTGTVWVYATVNAYGTTLQDSVLYTLGYPYAQTISTVKTNLAVTNLYQGQTITLAPGATVGFQNGVAATDPLKVAYAIDNPAAATAAIPASTVGGVTGSVTPLIGGQTSNRRFLTPGTYHWTAVTSGGPAPWAGVSMSGTIVIR